MKRLIAGLLLLVLLPACGGSNESSTPATTTSTIAYMFPPTLVENADDVAMARSVSALQTDFPEGWKSNSSTATTKPNELVIDEAFVQCLFGSNPSKLSAYVVSPVMAAPTETAIAQSFVRVVETSAAARADFQNFTEERAASCQKAMHARQFELPADAKIIGKKFGFDPPDGIPVAPLQSPDNSTDFIGFNLFISPRDAPAIYMDVFAYGIGSLEVIEVFQVQRTQPGHSSRSKSVDRYKSTRSNSGARARANCRWLGGVEPRRLPPAGALCGVQFVQFRAAPA